METQLQPAMKLTVTVGGDERHAHQPLFEEVLRVLRAKGLTGATVTKGIMSYGSRRNIHSTQNEITIENLPIIIEVIGDQERVEAAANIIAELLVGHGLIELHPTTVMRQD
jgi:PII-like signaling protein